MTNDKKSIEKSQEIKRLAKIIDANFSFSQFIRAKDPAQVNYDLDVYGNAFLDECGNSVDPLSVRFKQPK